MKTLDRLKLELSNKEYFSDTEYTQYLSENNLTANADYDKSTMQRDLLYTVIDVLESVSNNVDIMRRVETEFATIGDASKHLETRIAKIRKRISELPDNEQDGCFSLLFTRKQY